MDQLVLDKIAFETIAGKKIPRLTNEEYDKAAKKADRQIEENNREYAAAYKRAALFSAK